MDGAGLFAPENSLAQKGIDQNFFVVETKDPEQAIADAVESQKSSTLDEGELRDGGQNKKKNKKKSKK